MTKPRIWSWVLLFTTSGTLVCCAIPIALVTVGLGAALASMVSVAPWLVTLSLYKGWMFLGSGLLIVLGGFAVYRSGRQCPADPEIAAACERANTWNRRFLGLASVMWIGGFGAAYLLPLAL